MVLNIERTGNFTSSKIFKLMSNGKTDGTIGATGKTYIEDKKYERKLGRSAETQSYSRDMAWGIFLEKRVFDMLEYGYELQPTTTKVHPTINYWSGSTDLLMPGVKVGSIKCY